MNHERPDVVYYDSRTNVLFADALVDSIIVPAVFTALDKDISEGWVGDAIADCEIWYQGNRTEYEFLADQDSSTIVISSIAYMKMSDLSDLGAQLLHDNLQESNILDDVKGRYRDDVDRLKRDADVETFTRRTFYVHLNDDSSNVRVETHLGYAVDGQAIDDYVTYEPTPQLDMERETVFELGEILEIIKALLAMELIDQSAVKRFLEQEF